MNSRRAIVGLCMLCALALSAFAASSASANTAYTCAKTELKNGDFTDAHCKTPSEPGKGEYAHVVVNKQTNITGSNITTGAERSTAKLKSVQSGVTLELQATVVGGSGTMENKEEGATMWAEGSGTITYENVTVTAPAGKGCEVEGAKVKTNSLSASTKGLTGQLKFTPTAGETEPFAEFTVKGCSIGSLNHLYTAKGFVIGTIEGATTSATHAGVTAAKSLTLSGQQAGIEGSITINGENGNPLTVT